MSICIRMELVFPGNQIFMGNHQLYNVFVAGHAIMMIFFLVMPALIGAVSEAFKKNDSSKEEDPQKILENSPLILRTFTSS